MTEQSYIFPLNKYFVDFVYVFFHKIKCFVNVKNLFLLNEPRFNGIPQRLRLMPFSFFSSWKKKKSLRDINFNLIHQMFKGIQRRKKNSTNFVRFAWWKKYLENGRIKMSESWLLMITLYKYVAKQVSVASQLKFVFEREFSRYFLLQRTILIFRFYCDAAQWNTYYDEKK